METAITRYANEFDRRKSLAAAVKASERSVALAKEQYAAGSIDLLQVLDTQRNLFAAQDALAKSDQAVTIELISIYKGLGGGWEATETASRATAASVSGK